METARTFSFLFSFSFSFSFSFFLFICGGKNPHLLLNKAKLWCFEAFCRLQITIFLFLIYTAREKGAYELSSPGTCRQANHVWFTTADCFLFIWWSDNEFHLFDLVAWFVFCEPFAHICLQLHSPDMIQQWASQHPMFL